MAIRWPSGLYATAMAPPGVGRTRRSDGTSLREAARLVRMDSCNDTASAGAVSRPRAIHSIPAWSRPWPINVWPFSTARRASCVLVSVRAAERSAASFSDFASSRSARSLSARVSCCSAINAGLERACRTAWVDWTSANRTAKTVTASNPAAAIPEAAARAVALAPRARAARRAHPPRLDRLILDKATVSLRRALRLTRMRAWGPCRSPCAGSSRDPAARAGLACPAGPALQSSPA